MMKKAGILAAVTDVTLLCGSPASAQDQFSLTISSSLNASKAKMPLGAYTHKSNGGMRPMFIGFRIARPRTVVLETRQSSKTAQGKTEIVFNRYGDTDSLEGIFDVDW